MRTATRVLGFAGALALVAGTSAAQNNSNDSTFNNIGDFYFTYSSPSIGGTVGVLDSNGDLYWRAHPGDGFMSNVDDYGLGNVMDLDGGFETLLDENWSDGGTFLSRSYGPAVTNGLGGLEPAFFSLGFTTEVGVALGLSGFYSPCTIYTTFCTPPGSTCAGPGTAWAWVVDWSWTATSPGSGIVLPADGTSASDMAVTYFIKGGHTTTGHPFCPGEGTNETNDIHSVDETQADTLGGINAFGGFQLGDDGTGVPTGPINEGVVSMGEANETWRDGILNVQADSGAGVEISEQWGGAMNGRNLSVGGGVSGLGVELRDLKGSTVPNIAVAAASLIPLAPPGVPLFGTWLGILPDAVFNTTFSLWQGTNAAASPWFTTEGIFTAATLPLPSTLVGFSLYMQGATFDLTTLTAEASNVVKTNCAL